MVRDYRENLLVQLHLEYLSRRRSFDVNTRTSVAVVQYDLRAALSSSSLVFPFFVCRIFAQARGHHRQSRLFLFQVVCSVAIEESQMLEAIVQRRSLPIPICTAFVSFVSPGLSQFTCMRAPVGSRVVCVGDGKRPSMGAVD